jgi:hypothetical protein
MGKQTIQDREAEVQMIMEIIQRLCVKTEISLVMTTGKDGKPKMLIQDNVLNKYYNFTING